MGVSDLTRAMGSERSEIAALAAELASTNAFIERLIKEFNSALIEVCVTDREPPELRMRNWPVPGAERLIVHRSGEGGTFTVAQNTPVLLLPSLETRLGISVINSGANPATLFLTNDLVAPGATAPFAQGTAQIFLAANGGAWDGKLGNIFWGGSVTAVCTVAGGTTMVVASV